MSEGFNVSIGVELVEALARRVVEMLPDRDGSSSPWLDVQEAAEYLRTTEDSIRGMVKRRQIPFHKPNGRVLFHCGELDQWALEA